MSKEAAEKSDDSYEWGKKKGILLKEENIDEILKAIATKEKKKTEKNKKTEKKAKLNKTFESRSFVSSFKKQDKNIISFYFFAILHPRFFLRVFFSNRNPSRQQSD